MSEAIVVIAIVFVVVSLCRFFATDDRYIGYGWSLGWRGGKVVVLSRLLDSPSGRAEVRIGSVLVEYQGHPMDFAAAEDFKSFMKAHPRPELGQTERFVLYDGLRREIILQAELIQGPIPVHDPLPPIDPEDSWMFRHGMFLCLRTGQIVHTRSPSNAALDAMLGD